MQSDRIIAILAGGRGARLWPLSTAYRPKQFIPLFSGFSMLQKTFDRAASVVGPDAVRLVGNADHADLYLEQLPQLRQEQLILEPAGKGTAAALALTVAVCRRTSPEATVATIPSDHIIPDPAIWVETVAAALEFAAESDRLVVVGARPRPHETKFGYVVYGERIGGRDEIPVQSVELFVEKPDAEALEAMTSAGNCARNMGILAFRPHVLANEMQRLAPDVFQPIADAVEKETVDITGVYDRLPVLSVDEAVLQSSQRVAVAIGDIVSADAGDFVSLGDAIGRDVDGNAATGRVVAIDASDNNVFAGDATVALVGVSDLVVVVEGNHVLVCPADQTQRIREISENK